MEDIQKKFDILKESEDWVTLGWLCFNGFATYELDSSERKLLGELWDALTEDEQQMCENI